MSTTIKGMSPKLVLVTAVMVIFLGACNKETAGPAGPSGPSGPTGPTGPLSSGSIYGYVNLEDQYGSTIATGLSGDSLILNGSTVAVTDSTGKYTFSNQSTGVYTLSVAKSGFGSINTSTFQYAGGGNLNHNAKLSAIPNFAASLNTVIDTGITITLTGGFTTSDTRKRTVAVFVGNSSAVSSLPSTYLSNYSVNGNNDLVTFTLKIPRSDLTDLGFSSGQTVYFAVYGAASDYTSTSTYEDLTNTGKFYYTALSASASAGSVVLQ